MAAVRWCTVVAAALALLLADVGAALPQSSISGPQPVRAALAGRLFDGITNISIAGGYVFAIGIDRKTVYGHSLTARDAGRDTGRWQIANLPPTGRILLVGFHPSAKFAIWVQVVDLRPGYRDLGVGFTSYASNAFGMKAQSPGDPASSNSAILNLLQLAGWIAKTVNAASANDDAAALADSLLRAVSDGSSASGALPGTGEARRPPPDAIDLIFCIDTTGSMRDDIDAVKASASRIVDQTLAVSSSARLALVAYRDYGSDYVTKGFPFTTSRDQTQQAIAGLQLQSNTDEPEAVYQALLHAINTVDLGPWRDGVRKVIILMGDAPPHTKRHTLAEVVRAAEEVDPAHVFPIAIAGAGAETVRAFGEIANATGGAMGTTASAADLPRELLKMVRLGARMADADGANGTVAAAMGLALEVVLRPRRPRPARDVGAGLQRRHPGVARGRGSRHRRRRDALDGGTDRPVRDRTGRDRRSDPGIAAGVMGLALRVPGDVPSAQ